MQPSERSRTICRYCGVVAARLASACEKCQHPYADAAITIGDNGDTYWVAVRVTFQCSACSFESPLDSLDADGAITCAHCGVERRFEPTSWNEAIAFAHAVGDLAGPDTEGRAPNPRIYIGDENPHRTVGEASIFAEYRQTGFENVRGTMVPRALSLWASPGAPVCRRCFVPVRVELDSGGGLSSSCQRCGSAARYAFRESAKQLFPGLLAVLAEENRTDEQQRRVSVDGEGVSALTCPNCGAPLTPRGDERTVRCQFCNCECRIPARAMVRASSATLVPETWWILFGGASEKRRELEQPDDDPKGDLERAPKRPPSRAKQWALTFAFATLALAVGFGIAGSDAIKDAVGEGPPVPPVASARGLLLPSTPPAAQAAPASEPAPRKRNPSTQRPR